MRYQFNHFLLDLDRFELSEAGRVLKAEPQILDLLALLVRNRGRLVSKDEINEAIWRGRVVSDAALSSRIKTLRRLLGDDGRTQAVIQTVHRKGFRFLPEVAVVQNGQDEAETRLSAGDQPGRSKPQVAVMAFANQSPDPNQAYLSEGISADIIALLSRHRWLDVLARNTTFPLAESGFDVKRLGRELDVTYVVDGSVRRSGERVRVDVNLADAVSGKQLWSDRYDRELDDIFQVQDDITEKITARLEPEIGFAERAKAIQSRNPDLQAWDLYHQGVYHFFRFTGESNREAQALLKRSQELDPHFGEAWAWWAYAVILGMVYWDTPPTEALLDDALKACDRALNLDPNNALFYALRGRVLLARREYDQAIADNEKAIALNSSLAAAHCGLGDSLAYEGRYQDAMARFEHAVALSPNDPQLWAFYSYGALAKLFSEDFQDAADWSERAILIPNCQYWAHVHRAVAFAHLGRIGEAQKSLALVKQQLPEFSLAFVREKLFYLKREEQVELYVEGLKKAGLRD